MNTLSKQTFHRGTTLALCLVLLVSLSAVAYAQDSTKNGVDILVENPSRDDNPPLVTSTTTLPYLASGSTLYQSVYSNYMFKPSSDRAVRLNFSGTMNPTSQAATITITLYDGSTGGTFVASRGMPTGSSWTNYTPTPFTSLNPDHYYYFQITKDNTSYPLVGYSLLCY